MRWFVLLLLFCAPPLLVGQEIRVAGGDEQAAVVRLREILEEDYQLLRRDTVLPQSFHAAGNLVVLGGDVRLEGSVGGSIAVVDGVLFVRPSARVEGEIVAVGGEVYRSSLAKTGEVLALSPGDEVLLAESGDTVTLTVRPATRRWPVRWRGLLGLDLPTYDRVDGLTVGWGASTRLPGVLSDVTGQARLSYHTERNAVGGRLGLAYPVGGMQLSARVARRTVTNETWIRGDLENSLAALATRSDSRNYYLSDEIALVLQREPEPLIEGEGILAPRIVLRASRDRSVPASTPWSLLGRGDPWRPNPLIDAGTLASVVVGVSPAWKGQTSDFDGNLAVEWAPAAIGDFAFTQLVADGRWTMQALWGHRIGFRVHTRQTLGSSTAPRQRWSLVGGSGTLPTLEFGAMRGDRVAFLASRYLVPLPKLSLPLLGPAALRLEHRVGAAWQSGSGMPPWEQNLGVGLRVGPLQATWYVNPAEEILRSQLDMGLAYPR